MNQKTGENQQPWVLHSVKSLFLNTGRLMNDWCVTPANTGLRHSRIFPFSYLGSTSERQNQLLRQSFLVSNVDVNFPFIQGLLITFQTNRTQENWVSLIPLIVGILCEAGASSCKVRGGMNFHVIVSDCWVKPVGLWVICDKLRNSFHSLL